jgi:polysaccharide biosynthesis/export protein
MRRGRRKQSGILTNHSKNAEHWYRFDPACRECTAEETCNVRCEKEFVRNTMRIGVPVQLAREGVAGASSIPVLMVKLLMHAIARVAAFAALALLYACQSTGSAPPRAEANLEDARLHPSKPYLLGVGDTVEVKLFYHPELNEALNVLSDGTISLQLVGQIVADGKSPEALGKELEERYGAAGLIGPRVAVIVRKSASQKVFVGGEVAAPKLVPYEGRLSLTQAIFEAGGLRPTAARDQVVLLRDNGSAQATVRTVDLSEVLRNGRDIALQPYDVVVVPKSNIAKVNEFVDQYIRKVLPFDLTAGFNYVIGNTTTTTEFNNR